ncbi:glycosyltransferase family 1 protein [bacterium]|nr:glycosyltransferase family 1 protein [bacterium]
MELLPSPYYQLPKSWFPAQPAYTPLLPGGSWLPQGKLRSALSKIKSRLESHRKKNLLFAQKNTIFHSFFYTLPPKSDALVISMALDTVSERLGSTMISPDAFKSLANAKKKALTEADRVISISHSTTKDIIEIYDVPADHIDTIHLGVNSNFFSEKSPRYPGLNKPYLLQVGGRMHHRNFKNLLHAFALGSLRKELVLVCAGEPWNEEEETLMKTLGLRQSIHLVKQPSNLELRSLYQHAQMLVYPSLYEGFGFPLVEAMACGTPVATSLGAGSIPEVAGDAAYYFDPKDPNDIARKVTELLEPQRQNQLRVLGYENIKRFSWDKTAELTVETYRKVFSA